MKDMVENFTGFYNAFFEFSARSAYRIVKEKNAAMDIAQECISSKIRRRLISQMRRN